MMAMKYLEPLKDKIGSGLQRLRARATMALMLNFDLQLGILLYFVFQIDMACKPPCALECMEFELPCDLQ
jgi:hypothetical protein